MNTDILMIIIPSFVVGVAFTTIVAMVIEYHCQRLKEEEQVMIDKTIMELHRERSKYERTSNDNY